MIPERAYISDDEGAIKKNSETPTAAEVATTDGRRRQYISNKAGRLKRAARYSLEEWPRQLRRRLAKAKIPFLTNQSVRALQIRAVPIFYYSSRARYKREPTYSAMRIGPVSHCQISAAPFHCTVRPFTLSHNLRKDRFFIFSHSWKSFDTF